MGALAVIMRPSLPFAAEPQQAQRTGALLVLVIAGGIVAALFPLMLSVVYCTLLTTAATIVQLALMTAAIEFARRLLGDEAIGGMEFRS